MRAVRREERKVVRLAVRPPVLLKEVAAAQLRLAFRAHKVLGVPHLAQGRHHLRDRGGEQRSHSKWPRDSFFFFLLSEIVSP